MMGWFKTGQHMQTRYKANDDNAKPVLSTFPNFGEAILSGYGSHKIAKSQAIAAIRSTSTAESPLHGAFRLQQFFPRLKPWTIVRRSHGAEKSLHWPSNNF